MVREAIVIPRRFDARTVVVLLCLGGCSAPPTSAAESDVLGVGRVLVSTEGAGTFSLPVTIYTPPDTEAWPKPKLFELAVIGDGDEGDTLVATADTDADFAPFAQLLTDGVDEWMQVSVPGSGASLYQMESLFFSDRPGTGPDFVGNIVDRIDFVIDSIGPYFVAPGVVHDHVLDGRVVVRGRRSAP